MQTAKERLSMVSRILAPLLMTMVFLGGLLGVMRLPEFFRTLFTVQQYGAAGAALRVMLWSDLALLAYIVVASLLIVGIMVIWFIFARRRQRDVKAYQFLRLGALCLFLSVGLSVLMLQDTNILGEIKGAREDLQLLEKGYVVTYEGSVGSRGPATYPGLYYDQKPKDFVQLRVLEGGWASVLCPLPLAQRSGANEIVQSDSPSDKFLLTYLPNTRIVTEITPLE